MKLNLFRWAAIALLAAIPLVATPQYAIVLDEDFEECADGSLPSGWTLEYVTDTRQNWAVESGGDYPAGAYAGSNKRVALRNSTDMTIGCPCYASPTHRLSGQTTSTYCGSTTAHRRTRTGLRSPWPITATHTYRNGAWTP